MTRDYAALLAYFEARARMPFAWGWKANDCVSFAAGAVEAQTGRNPLAAAGHTWTTKMGAARVLNRIGGVAAAADLVLPRLPATGFAHRGDVGLVELEGRACLVVFEGELLRGPGPRGTALLPRRLATVAWSAVR